MIAPEAEPISFHPVLFARFWSGVDEQETAVLVERTSSIDLDRRRDWSVHITAPGGMQARGQLHAGRLPAGQDLYAYLLSLFGAGEPTRLWFAPVGEPAGVLSSAFSVNVPLALWDRSGRNVIEEDILRLPNSDSAAFSAHPRGGAEVGFLEALDPEDASIFSRMGVGDLLTFDVTSDASERPLPRINSRLGYHTAYWSFLRSGMVEATMKVAQRMMDEVADKRPGRRLPGEETVIAASHAMLRFRQFWSYRAEVADHLEKMDGVDARLMRWVIHFEMDARSEFLGSGFAEALASIKQEMPIYSETMRLFYERLSTAIALSGNALSAPVQEDARFAELLASSTYWNSEHLLYRGSSPWDPKPAVSDVQSTQKKKTTGKKSGERYSSDPGIGRSR